MSITIHVRTAAGSTEVTMAGLVDEHADFTAISDIRGRVRLDVRGIRRINSYGCRKWMDALRALCTRGSVTVVAASPAVIDQLNTTYGFLGAATVESFVGVMRCEPCDDTFDHVFDSRTVADRGLPPVNCPKCR